MSALQVYVENINYNSQNEILALSIIEIKDVELYRVLRTKIKKIIYQVFHFLPRFKSFRWNVKKNV